MNQKVLTVTTRRCALATLAFAVPLLAQTAPAPKPIRVLFIGNSYTFFNNLPRLLETIAASQRSGPKIATEAVLKGGESLKGHWNAGKALEAIRKGGWDFVVLQEQSMLGTRPAPGAQPLIDDPAQYLEYGRRFDEEIRKAGARTLLYATWAREHYPEHQRRLDDAFVRLARETNAAIVPVGLAWTVARIEVPGIRLHTPDRSHPTAAGSYLAALVFYQTVAGHPASNPPVAIDGTLWNSDKPVTLVNLTWSDARALETIAQRAFEQEPLRFVRQR